MSAASHFPDKSTMAPPSLHAGREWSKQLSAKRPASKKRRWGMIRLANFRALVHATPYFTTATEAIKQVQRALKVLTDKVDNVTGRAVTTQQTPAAAASTETGSNVTY